MLSPLAGQLNLEWNRDSEKEVQTFDDAVNENSFSHQLLITETKENKSVLTENKEPEFKVPDRPKKKG